VGSPMLVSQFWYLDLHLSNVASLPAGLWAAAVLIREHRSRLKLAGALGLVLVFLSTTYNYQWFVAPVALALMLYFRRPGIRSALAVTAGAVVTFAVLTLAIQRLLDFSALGPNEERMSAVQQPTALAVERYLSATSLSEALARLPSSAEVLQLAEPYHPLCFLIGVVGLILLGRRAFALTALAIVLPLFFGTLYSKPWVFMTGYPLMYVGAGLVCARLGAAVGRALGGHALQGGRSRWVGGAVTVVAVLALFWLTNADLFGDPTLPVRWWDGNGMHAIY
jgi:hypothetical protein